MAIKKGKPIVGYVKKGPDKDITKRGKYQDPVTPDLKHPKRKLEAAKLEKSKSKKVKA